MGSWRSTHPTETTFVDLLRVEEMQRANWMICLVWIQDGGICCELMKNDQQSQNLFLEADPRSTFRINFLQPAIKVFVARPIDHAR